LLEFDGNLLLLFWHHLYFDSCLCTAVLLMLSVVTGPSIKSFKNRLDNHWASQELRYYWEAELSGTRSRSRVEF